MKRRIIEVLVLIIAFLAGMFFFHFWQSTKDSSNSKTERKVLYWVAPMDSNYRRDKPGKSPMGMDLVPVY
ncbi:TPA: hypothetical protein JBF46_00745 [Legionella pneumophila]|uniref:heavy metal-binding domain-containing protein n=1 Tax=Legionella pneumophila TaxID=446 RepID=UPI00077C5D59|nr:heavy metal-binding domain-containing protein [Legionella pneumophila]PQM73289.1 hypothetical protein C3926_00755 [Legionella pneumophila]HAT3844107.1 hypothetical protein [Legionella pneumophila]HAU0263353.1 hypothetical protein [Legionella pneumophila]HAU0297885.1 hypothetical protein [Legionella pneumophila]HAU0298698.1 hypothetical protein [Legionella pneumophila]